MQLLGFNNFGESAWMFSFLRCEAVLLATMKPNYCKRLTQNAQFVRKKAGFHGQVIQNDNLSGRRRGFTDEIHSVRQRLTGIAVELTKKCGALRGMMQHRIGLSRTTCMSVFGVYR